MKLAGMRRGNMCVALENMEKSGFIMSKVELADPNPMEISQQTQSEVATKVKPKEITKIQFKAGR